MKGGLSLNAWAEISESLIDDFKKAELADFFCYGHMVTLIC